MRAPSVDLSDMLAEAGVGVIAAESGWGIYTTRLPDTPDTAIALMDTPGLAPEIVQPIDRPVVQVLVRGTANGYDEAYAKAMGVRDRLHSMGRVTVGDTEYMFIHVFSDVGLIEYDENQRPVIAANYAITRRVPAGPWRGGGTT